IEFHTIPVRLEGPSGQEDVVADKAEVHRFVANLLLPPEERAKKEQEQKRLEAAREQVTVSVYNGTGISGLANRVLESLSAEGFTPGGTGNSDSTSESLVYHAEGDEASGKLVSDALGGVPTAPSPNLSSGQVEVHRGSDNQGPGAQTFAANPQVQLDGMAQVGPLPVQLGEAAERVITAGGVPCVHCRSGSQGGSAAMRHFSPGEPNADHAAAPAVKILPKDQDLFRVKFGAAQGGPMWTLHRSGRTTGLSR